MSEWNERMYEARARYISAAYLIDTDEIAVLAPEVPLPENHNCDAMGCGSMSHVAFRAPRDVMNQLDDCADKLREAEAKLAAAQTRIAELEEERVELRNALARIRDYNPPDEMSHKAWRVRINVMRNWAGKALAPKGRKDGEHDCMGV